jgi:hypothetical protein
MTEDEWLACDHQIPMIAFLCNRASERKFRLFTVACCRRIWHLIQDGVSRTVVEVAERYADSLAKESERAEAESLLDPASSSAEAAAHHAITQEWSRAVGAALTSRTAVSAVRKGSRWGRSEDAPGEEAQAQIAFLRDIFGNPFRPPAPLDPAILTWNDSTVKRISEGIYNERRMPEGTLDTARLAILHDALLDAGCNDEALLTHLRSDGPHVRGCWAIDLILSKDR